MVIESHGFNFLMGIQRTVGRSSTFAKTVSQGTEERVPRFDVARLINGAERVFGLVGSDLPVLAYGRSACFT